MHFDQVCYRGKVVRAATEGEGGGEGGGTVFYHNPSHWISKLTNNRNFGAADGKIFETLGNFKNSINWGKPDFEA